MPVCLSADHVRKPCKNGWTDRDTVWGLTHVGRRNHVLDGAQIPEGKRQVGVVRPIEKHCQSLMRCTLQKKSITARLSATTAANGNAADWSLSHYIAPPSEKSAPLRFGLSPKFFDHLLSLVYWVTECVVLYDVTVSPLAGAVHLNTRGCSALTLSSHRRWLGRVADSTIRDDVSTLERTSHYSTHQNGRRHFAAAGEHSGATPRRRLKSSSFDIPLVVILCRVTTTSTL